VFLLLRLQILIYVVVVGGGGGDVWLVPPLDCSVFAV
jgi:hypothetical protein